MMLFTGCINQPHQRSNCDMIAEILGAGEVQHIDIAAAYVTSNGVRDLFTRMRQGLGPNWENVNKRWLIAFDYCRTEPAAAGMLRDIPNSRVRIHDGENIVNSKKCIPKIPFHPKAFLFRGPGRHALYAGSGNVSRSGLNTGHEVGILLDCRAPANVQDAQIRQQISAVQTWYELRWGDASPFTPALAKKYKTSYDSADNLQNPAPTDEDQAKPDDRPSTLSSESLHKLRAAHHFWIEAGNITKNLGPDKPGNQLMMKRLSRVFFGVPAYDVDHNSPLTKLTIKHKGHSKDDCSLTFSDNGMDKLTLPLPGAGGPAAYDQRNLLFIRTGAGVFDLELGSATDKKAWIKKSEAIDASFEMSQGRRWGVF